jgi:hypothetical protein
MINKNIQVVEKTHNIIVLVSKLKTLCFEQLTTITLSNYHYILLRTKKTYTNVHTDFNYSFAHSHPYRHSS